MHTITTLIKKISFLGAAFVVGAFGMVGMGFQSAAFADDPTTCTAPSDSTYGSGVHRPVGSDASMYTYNCATGLWTSQYYTYNPSTGVTSPTYALNYKYDCAAGQWTMDDYYFSAADNAYHYSRIPAASDPGLATNCPVAAPTPPTPAPTAATATTSNSSPASAGTAGGSGSTVANTGPGSVNSAGNTITLNNSNTNNTKVDMSNLIWAGATTGNALVSGNTTGGNATSGNAQSVANIANLLQSSANVFGPNTVTFTANINGDVNGDFMFDPSAILASGPGSTNTASNTLTVNSNNTNNVNAAINNNIDVGAASGNATVAGNTNGGNATSGDASAVVNLMNLINSVISAGQSFVGTININGNLNGDILLPQGVLDQLLASTGPGSNNLATTNLTDNSTTTNNITQGIANNITSKATTGTATVSDNTSGGNATSGTAGTNVTLLNLTGSNTVGKDDLLVFVNVLGKWVGMIMNAPTGSTAAELGGGITSSGPNSNNTTANNVTDNSTTTNNVNEGITNNVNVHANSGNATVNYNTLGGNATSGNAHTAVNVLNMEGSNLSLSNWFGVLFINVFGAWTGSFGINTSAGDPINNPTMNPVQAANEQNMVNTVRHFASFAPRSGSSGGSGGVHSASNTFSSGNTGTGTDAGVTSSVLGTATSAARQVASAAKSALPTPDNGTHTNFMLPLIGVSLAAVLLLISERDRFFGTKH